MLLTKNLVYPTASSARATKVETREKEEAKAFWNENAGCCVCSPSTLSSVPVCARDFMCFRSFVMFSLNGCCDGIDLVGNFSFDDLQSFFFACATRCRENDIFHSNNSLWEIEYGVNQRLRFNTVIRPTILLLLDSASRWQICAPINVRSDKKYSNYID